MKHKNLKRQDSNLFLLHQKTELPPHLVVSGILCNSNADGRTSGASLSHRSVGAALGLGSLMHWRAVGGGRGSWLI